jgi:hypothetical protein
VVRSNVIRLRVFSSENLWIGHDGNCRPTGPSEADSPQALSSPVVDSSIVSGERSQMDLSCGNVWRSNLEAMSLDSTQGCKGGGW